ncbi:MAG: hypothetical protein KAT90_15280, partial [Gammaproteobacteria bacterium]|nr:hypothetical protein [Gammaproteobacteria bacterium]
GEQFDSVPAHHIKERSCMSKGNDKKSKQLGMPIGTASNRLRKLLMFSMAKELGRDICHQCGEKIETPEEFSIEHKEPWLDAADPIGMFFDLDNISFSHLMCNCGAGRRPTKKYFTDEYRKAAKALSDHKCYSAHPIELRRKKRREKYIRLGT